MFRYLILSSRTRGQTTEIGTSEFVTTSTVVTNPSIWHALVPDSIDSLTQDNSTNQASNDTSAALEPCKNRICTTLRNSIDSHVDVLGSDNSDPCRDPYSFFCANWESSAAVPPWKKLIESRGKEETEHTAYNIIKDIITSTTCEEATEPIIESIKNEDEECAPTLTSYEASLSCLYELCVDLELMDTNLGVPLEEILVLVFGSKRIPIEPVMPENHHDAMIQLSKSIGTMIAYGFPSVIDLTETPDVLSGSRSPSIIMRDPLRYSAYDKDIFGRYQSPFRRFAKVEVVPKITKEDDGYVSLLAKMIELYMDITMEDAIGRAEYVTEFERGLQQIRNVDIQETPDFEAPVASLWVHLFKITTTKQNSFFSWQYLSAAFFEVVLTDNEFETWRHTQQEMQNLLNTVDHLINHEESEGTVMDYKRGQRGVPPLAYVYLESPSQDYIDNLPNYINDFLVRGGNDAWQAMSDYLMTRIFLAYRNDLNYLWRSASVQYDRDTYNSNNDNIKIYRERSDLCVDRVIETVPWIVGKAYIDRTQVQYHQMKKGKSYRGVVMRMMRFIDETFLTKVTKSSWYKSETNHEELERAQAKITNAKKNIGHPDWIHETEENLVEHFNYLYGNPMIWLIDVRRVIKRELPSTTPKASFLGVNHYIRFHRLRMKIRNIGREINVLEPRWHLLPFEANMQYKANYNTISVPDAMIGPPYLVEGCYDMASIIETDQGSDNFTISNFIEYAAINAANYGAFGSRLALVTASALSPMALNYNESGNYKLFPSNEKAKTTNKSSWEKSLDCLKQQYDSYCAILPRGIRYTKNGQNCEGAGIITSVYHKWWYKTGIVYPYRLRDGLPRHRFGTDAMHSSPILVVNAKKFMSDIWSENAGLNIAWSAFLMDLDVSFRHWFPEMIPPDDGGIGTIIDGKLSTLSTSFLKDFHVIPGYTIKEIFFTAYTTILCTKIPVDYIVEAHKFGHKLPNRFRIDGALRNSRQFASTYNCNLGDMPKLSRSVSPSWVKSIKVSEYMGSSICEIFPV